CPLQCCPIPEPGVTEVIAPVEASEKHYLLGNSIVSHLACSAGGRGGGCDDLRPGVPVEAPCVIEVACGIESAEGNDLPGHRDIRRRKLGARRRPVSCGKHDPIGGG